MKTPMAAFVLILAAGPVAAEAPNVSPRPPARAETTATQPAILPHLRPKVRPDTEASAQHDVTAGLTDTAEPARPHLRPPSEQQLREAAITGAVPLNKLESSKRPWLRPESLVEEVMAKRRLRRKGAVCGNIDLQGEDVGYVPAEIRGCGIKDAVRLRSVSGVTLSQPALLTCETAQALNKWVSKSVKPAFGGGDPVVSLRVAAHYACRTRNNVRGAKISEHGQGKAIDISAFNLQSGRVVTVLGDWAETGPLKKLHRKACGVFGTVLGPNADHYHRDHFHLDTARHRGGAYCR